MFLKIATVIAIVGVALSLLLALIQQVIFAARIYGSGIMMFTRLLGMLDLVLLNGSILLFLVAFLFSLRAKTSDGAFPANS
jgi:hypothetical protein